MFAPSLRCESWRGILSPVDSTYSGVDRTKSGVDSTKSGADSAKSGVDSTKGGRIERRMGGLNDEQEGQGKREESGGVGYKKKGGRSHLGKCRNCYFLLERTAFTALAQSSGLTARHCLIQAVATPMMLQEWSALMRMASRVSSPGTSHLDPSSSSK